MNADTRASILTAIHALQQALRNLPPESHPQAAQLIAAMPQPIPARTAYRQLASQLGISQRHCPALMTSLGYERIKKEAGIYWTSAPQPPA